MEKFNNAGTFAKQYETNTKIPKKMCELLVFTLKSKLGRNINSIVSRKIKKDKNNGEYIFNYNGKKFSFSLFSDWELQKVDIKRLTTIKRLKHSLSRTLKLACSLDLTNPRVVIGNSTLGVFSTLILYQEKGIEKVIDYGYNLVMTKDEYYNLFDFTELNIVDKVDLYNIYFLMTSLDDYGHVFEYLIFIKELYKDLGKNRMFNFFNKKYDEDGINSNNYSWFGNDCDSLFFQEEDTGTMKYASIIDEVDKFTMDPTKFTRRVTYDEDKHAYRLEDKKFGHFTFNLLSDMLVDEKIKRILLSKDRYGFCHKNSIMVANGLSSEDKKSTYVVSGTFKENEKDSFNHSWVEVEDKNIVIDFNHNIIMNRDKYYKLFEIKVISRTLISELVEKIIPTICEEVGLDLHTLQLNYFGKEIYNDLMKNEKILKKRK